MFYEAVLTPRQLRELEGRISNNLIQITPLANEKDINQVKCLPDFTQQVGKEQEFMFSYPSSLFPMLT
jgi:hypothetical protein